LFPVTVLLTLVDETFEPETRENGKVSNKELQALKERYVAAGAASPNEQFADHATNAELWDADGKRMIDFAGGIGVLNIGHRHPKVVEAVKAQLDKLMHTCQTVMPY
jgi:4-aminobutyrate aminotransferase/(S)-3-amino-2-methylpropionate transaminase